MYYPRKGSSHSAPAFEIFFPHCHIIFSYVDHVIHLFTIYLLITYCVPGTALDAEATVNKVDPLCKKKKENSHRH